MTQLMDEPIAPGATEPLPMPFKVFGLQRSGTNLMVALMTRNFQVHSLEIGAEWKHGPLMERDRQWRGQLARFVLCVRNPYAWLTSCYRYFRRGNGTDGTVAEQFKRDPSVSFEEFVLTPTYGFANQVDRWNQMLRLWLRELPSDRTVVVRQEDQMLDQGSVLSRLETGLALHRRAAELQAIDRRVDVNACLHGSFDSDRAYYLSRQYMTYFSPCLLERVNALLDGELLTRFGYELESHALAEREIRGITLHVRCLTSDAGDARECTFDPYEFEAVQKAGNEVRTYVDIGAHIGATLILAKRLWPKCRAVCYEPVPENARLLKINTQRFSDVTIVAAAVSEPAQSEVALTSPPAELFMPLKTSNASPAEAGELRVPAVSLKDAVARVGAIDLLKIGCPQSVKPILRQLKTEIPPASVRVICGRTVPQHDFERWALAELGEHYHVQMLGKKPKRWFKLTLRDK